ncbi:hypothetical protein MTO96_043499 [Rhipicephalus appendiculatus]
MTSASGPSVGSGAGVKKNPWNRRYCCVKGCHNHEGQPGIKFYRFPGRSYEINRRKKWIAAVRRVNAEEESTRLHEDPASQEGELIESLPSALDDSAVEESTLLHGDTVSQEGELLESLPSALDDNAEGEDTGPRRHSISRGPAAQVTSICPGCTLQGD